MSNDQGGFEFSFEEQPPVQQQPYGAPQTYQDAGGQAYQDGGAQEYQPAQSGRTVADFGGGQGVSQGAQTAVDGGGGGHAEGEYDLQAIVGRTVDRYKIDRLLGEGGFGAVYLAQHTLMKRAVAFKTLHADLAKDPAVLYRFLREGQCSTRFKHRNAIELYDFGQMDDGTYFMAMELLHGEDLRDTIKRKGALELGETFDIMLQTLGALHSMHEGGVIHRDLKPDDIKLEEDEGRDNFVKVFDFGIAKLLDSDEPEPEIDADPSVLEQEIKPGDQYKTTVGAFFGTPEYGSPEQCAGEEIDPRSDLYTMGVILYECLTGQLPFASKTPQGYLAQHMVGEPKPVREINTEVPEEVELLVQKSMAKDREERFQTAAEFAEALVECAQKCGIPLTVGLGDAIVVKTPIWKIALFTLIPIIAIAAGAIYYVSTQTKTDPEWENAQGEVASLIEQFKYEDALAKTEDFYGQRFGTEYAGYFNGYFDEAGTEKIEDPTRANEALVPGKLAEIRSRISKRDAFVEAELKRARDGLRKPLDERVYLPLIEVVKTKVMGDPETAAKPGVVDEIDALEREVLRTRKADSENLAKKLIKESDPFLVPDVLDFASARDVLTEWPTKFETTDANKLIEAQKDKIDTIEKATNPKEKIARTTFFELKEKWELDPESWESMTESLEKFGEEFGGTQINAKAQALKDEVDKAWEEAAQKALEELREGVKAALAKGTIDGLLEAHKLIEDFDRRHRKRAHVELERKKEYPKVAAAATERYAAAKAAAAAEHQKGHIQAAIDAVKPWSGYPLDPKISGDVAELIEYYTFLLPLHTDAKMVAIPAADVSVGDNRHGAGRGPQTPRPIKAFYLDRHEVTNGEFNAFVTRTGYDIEDAALSARLADSALVDHPVRGVAYADAEAYAKWVGKRLPTEFEWEYAGRGAQPFKMSGGKVSRGLGHVDWPWGSAFLKGTTAEDAANLEPRDKGGDTVTVGSHGVDQSTFGVFDLAGNVREWTDSPFVQYTNNRDPKHADNMAKYGFNPTQKVLRGASPWTVNTANPMMVSRLCKRAGADPADPPEDAGFRCAKDAD